MSKRNRKRRESARRQKEQRQAKLAAQPEGVPGDAPDEEAATEDEAARARRREQQKREYEKRKRQRDRGRRSAAPFVWGGAVAGVIALAAIGGVLLLGGGGDEATGEAPTASPDPRIAGLPIDRTIEVQADDDGQNVNTRYVPNSISGRAGEVIEVLVTNVGSVAHNLRFPGADGEYATPDDWAVNPLALQPGDTGRVVVKFDDPGAYPFRCDFHPQIHFGTLTLG